MVVRYLFLGYESSIVASIQTKTDKYAREFRFVFFFVRLKSAFITFIFNCLPCSVGQRARVSYFKCMSLAHDYTEYDRVLFLLQIALLK